MFLSACGERKQRPRERARGEEEEAGRGRHEEATSSMRGRGRARREQVDREPSDHVPGSLQRPEEDDRAILPITPWLFLFPFIRVLFFISFSVFDLITAVNN